MARVAIVTGGSRGTGRRIAASLAGRGYAVAVVYSRDQCCADAAVEEIVAAGGVALAIRADVTDRLDVERAFAETAETLGEPEVVVHAAGAPGGLVRAQAASSRARRELVDQGSPGCDSRLGTRAWGSITDLVEDQMASSDVSIDTPAAAVAPGDMRLEIVVLPVSDVDRAKRFYQSLNWRLDADFPGEDGFRVVQLTPPGSMASIIFGDRVTDAVPGSIDALMLVVADIDAAREGLLANGVAVSDIFHDAGGVFHHAGTAARVPGPDPHGRSYSSFASFSDPDGNGWMLQEIKARLPGR